MHTRATAAALLLALAWPAQAAKPTEVDWLTVHLPPHSIRSELPGEREWSLKGYGDQGVDWFIARLPEYRIRRVPAPPARAAVELARTDRTSCLSGARYTAARAAMAYGSAPAFHGPPNRVMARADAAGRLLPHLDANGALRFERLAQDEGLRGALTRDRAYGDVVNQAAAGSRSIYLVPEAVSPLRMLFLGRVDWVVAAPHELTWHRRISPTPLPATRSFAIAGHEAQTVGHIWCSKTPTGKRLIERIDALMRAHPQRPWEAQLPLWLDADEQAERLRQMERSGALPRS